MQVERLVDHQIQVRAVNENGVLTLSFPDGQQCVWPITDSHIASGTFYLILSPAPVLPTQDELVQLVLREILKLDQ